MTDTFNDETVYNLVCFVCAQSKTHTGLRSRTTSFERPMKLCEIQYRHGEDLQRWWPRDCEHFENNFGCRKFIKRYGGEWKVAGRRDEELIEFGPTPWEWRRNLQLGREAGAFEMLCCPEDVQCRMWHGKDEICTECEVPICADCFRVLQGKKDVPMAVANDNMWGYVTDIITRYQVRWIEMAAVLPYWTCMIVYYVEGDRGDQGNSVGLKTSRV